MELIGKQNLLDADAFQLSISSEPFIEILTITAPNQFFLILEDYP